jgi:hypothetical protein
MSARTFHGGVPAPPKPIAAEMFEAGRTGDQARLNVAASAYRAWLADEGYETPQGRPARADEVAR